MMVDYLMIYRLSYKWGDCLEFLPSTKQYSEISISIKDLLKSFRARNAQLEKFPVKTNMDPLATRCFIPSG